MKHVHMKFAIRMLAGRSPELYMAVGHLVLSSTCLRENNNYPYKSSGRFIWHVLYYEEKVVAFMPVERKISGDYKIDNYYATPSKERGYQLLKLLKNVIKEIKSEDVSLQATVQKRDIGVFKHLDFIILRETTRYAMMRMMHVDADCEKKED